MPVALGPVVLLELTQQALSPCASKERPAALLVTVKYGEEYKCLRRLVQPQIQPHTVRQPDVYKQHRQVT